MKASFNTKFTSNDILKVRRMQGKMVAREIADVFGVSPETIRKIWRGDTFRNVGETVGNGNGSNSLPEKGEVSPLWAEPSEEEAKASLERLIATGIDLKRGDTLLEELEREEEKR